MKVNRVVQIDTSSFQIGDQISVGCYTATCQRVMAKGSIFLMDQYLTGNGCLRESLQSEEILTNFADIRDQMVPFEDGDMLKIPYGYYGNSEIARFRPIFLISMKNEDTIKKSAPEDEETVRDVLDTFNETQRLVLYYIVGKEIEGEETILDVLNTFNDKQRLVLNYLVKKAVKDAKKGKTSKSKKQ